MTDQRRDDEELTAGLQRRADRVRHSHDWARRELLPSINAAIDTRPVPVATSRGPAFAGLAGLVAILLVLVVALPSFVPGPSASEPPVVPTDTAAASGPIRPEIISAQEFAVEVLTGRLRSSTVLVDGTIGARPDSVGIDCHVPPGESCLMGRLEGTDPSVDVVSRWLATDERQPGVPKSDEMWTWWHLPSGPVTGTLVLSVDSDGTIEFLGRVDPANGADPMTVAEANQKDVESVPLDEVVLVDGWLTGIPIHPCPTDDGTWIAGLPSRHCRDAWLVDDLNARFGTGIRLQGSAYYDYAADPQRPPIDVMQLDPQRAVYALAKRLEGGGCPADPPCWQWEAVGRVSDASIEPSPSPPTRTPAEPVPTPDIARPVLGCTGDTQVTVHDEIGVVENCIASAVQGDTDDPPTIENLAGDRRYLSVSWSGSLCRYELHLRPKDGAHELEIRQVSNGCRLAFVRNSFGLRLNTPIDAADVDLVFTAEPEEPSAAPRILQCGHIGPLVPSPDAPRELAASVIDETGIVNDCTIWRTILDGPSVVVENPSPSNDQLQISWTGSACDASVTFTFGWGGSPYRLRGEREQGDCDDPAAHTMTMSLTRVILASSVEASVSGTEGVAPTPDVAPPPGDALIECTQPTAEFGALVIDPTGLVDSCATVEPTGEGVAEDPVVRNPNGTLTELQIEWPGTPCAAAVAFTVVPGATGLSLEIGPRPDGKTLGTDSNGTVLCIQSRVIHAIRLQLNGSVDARNVWISRTAVPTTSIRTISCDRSEIDIQDSTNLILSCRDTDVDQGSADGNPLITNPGGETFLLHVFWLFQDPNACSPQPPSLALDFRQSTVAPGFVVSTAADFVPGTGCVDVARWFGLEIELSEPVPSSDITFATSGRGAVATAKTAVGIFDLMINADKVEYVTGEPIEIDAVLQYDGGDPLVELWGVISLINGFGIKQLDGPLVMGPGWDQPCLRHELQRREPLRVPYEKSAAWSDDDPNAGFYRDWLSDSELRLPGGTWLVTAYSEFAIGSDCAGPLVSLQASLVIVVR